ncbi:hypothetical protein POM88_034857 [Heracleum sosnowskyi]|uniref:Uncharacterized protein n=1 Tax=Heracleum sosnowskyi TaxID=360622 RepID=A0AAD8HK32_9APIA|nr:hypothetical protein POM88_034857 [Heracleum sosnowskyi]
MIKREQKHLIAVHETQIAIYEAPKLECLKQLKTQLHASLYQKMNSSVMSASGGKVSLFNMMTFKVMTTFMPPPPAATYLAFHPQDNNIIAIGMEDSTIQIYNVRVDEVKTKLKGHQKPIRE